MNKKLIITLLTAIVVIGVGTGYGLAQKNKTDKKAAEHSATMKKDEEAAKMKQIEAMKHDDTAMTKTVDAMTVKGSFSDYDKAKLSNADKNKVVLFFSASWCPTCQEANKNFKMVGTPNGLTLLKVDYDTSADLKKMYGVTYQHTFVQVDKNGTLLKKWSGSTTYDSLLGQAI